MRSELTSAELVALKGLAKGKTYKQIATEEHKSVSTVRTQLHGIYAKLGVVDRAQAVFEAARRGLVDIPGLVPTPPPLPDETYYVEVGALGELDDTRRVGPFSGAAAAMQFADDATAAYGVSCAMWTLVAPEKARQAKTMRRADA